MGNFHNRGVRNLGGNSKVFVNLPRGGGVVPGGKIPLNCLELIFLGLINSLTCTVVKCDTPESISIPLTPQICLFLNLIVSTFYQGWGHFILLIVPNLGRGQGVI